MPSVVAERGVPAVELELHRAGRGKQGQRLGRELTGAERAGGSPEHSREVARLLRAAARRTRNLGRYDSSAADPRQLLAVSRADGGTLVVDCRRGSLGDARLVACIAPEEPAENPRIVSALYLTDASRGVCRSLMLEDFEPVAHVAAASHPLAGACVIDCGDCSYRIRTVADGDRFPELRWTSSRIQTPDGKFEEVTLRGVIDHLESYEPPRTLTQDALAAAPEQDAVSTNVLRYQLERVLCSPIVLNRGLREAVEGALAAGATMSEIAIRCGRIKHDRRGNASGETSWLARRIGNLPEAGRSAPTRWVHSDTLALIAREGLGLNPNEVEL